MNVKLLSEKFKAEFLGVIALIRSGNQPEVANAWLQRNPEGVSQLKFGGGGFLLTKHMKAMKSLHRSTGLMSTPSRITLTSGVSKDPATAFAAMERAAGIVHPSGESATKTTRLSFSPYFPFSFEGDE